MSKFKVNDKVKIISKTVGNDFSGSPHSATGTIDKIYGNPYQENDSENCFVIDGMFYAVKDLELIENSMSNKIEFKIGDRVKYTSNNHGDRESNPLWGGDYGKVKGTITDIDSIRVKWDNGNSNSYSADDLELIKKGNKIMNLVEKLLKPEDYLIKKYYFTDSQDSQLDLNNGDVQFALLELIRENLVAKAKVLKKQEKNNE